MIIKPLSDFSKHKSCSGGVRSFCKQCAKIAAEDYKKRNPEKFALSKRQWREKNPEKSKAATSAWTAANPERARASIKRWCSENQDRVKENQALWAANNRESRNSSERNRRARKQESEGQHSRADIERIFEMQKAKCASCVKRLHVDGVNKYHVDHIKPLALGGGNGPENLQMLCPGCNRRKSAKDPLDWANENGRLL